MESGHPDRRRRALLEGEDGGVVVSNVLGDLQCATLRSPGRTRVVDRRKQARPSGHERGSDPPLPRAVPRSIDDPSRPCGTWLWCTWRHRPGGCGALPRAPASGTISFMLQPPPNAVQQPSGKEGPHSASHRLARPARMAETQGQRRHGMRVSALQPNETGSPARSGRFSTVVRTGGGWRSERRTASSPEFNARGPRRRGPVCRSRCAATEPLLRDVVARR